MVRSKEVRLVIEGHVGQQILQVDNLANSSH